MPGTIRTIINEPHFEITIYEWNDLTLDMLKLYSDWKCNGNQQTTLKKETIDNVKINVKKPLDKEIIQSKDFENFTKIKKKPTIKNIH